MEIQSIILALGMAGAAGLVGAFALMKKITIGGDVISHVALPGLGIAFLFHFNPIVGGAATLLIGTVLIWHLEKRAGLSTETAIGVIFAASVAIGALLTPEGDIVDALFGGFQSPTPLGFTLGLAAILLIIGFIFTFKNQLIIALFSSELAATSGINVNRLNLLYLMVFSLTILLGLQFLGALLVGALIIIPAAIGRQLTHTLNAFLLTSSVASVVSVGLGLLVNYYYGLVLGPTIVSIATVIFVISLLKKKQ